MKERNLCVHREGWRKQREKERDRYKYTQRELEEIDRVEVVPIICSDRPWIGNENKCIGTIVDRKQRERERGIEPLIKIHSSILVNEREIVRWIKRETETECEEGIDIEDK